MDGYSEETKKVQMVPGSFLSLTHLPLDALILIQRLVDPRDIMSLRKVSIIQRSRTRRHFIHFRTFSDL